MASTETSKKKWGRGTILLVALGGLMFAGFVAAAIGVYVVLSSEKGRAIVGQMGEGYKLIQKSRSAPGMKELRAMGCSEAIVMATDDVLRTIGRDGGASHANPEIVVCQVGLLSKTLQCDDVAHEYVATLGARPQSFIVTIQRIGAAKPLCSVQYDRSGTSGRDVTHL